MTPEEQALGQKEQSQKDKSGLGSSDDGDYADNNLNDATEQLLDRDKGKKPTAAEELNEDDYDETHEEDSDDDPAGIKSLDEYIKYSHDDDGDNKRTGCTFLNPCVYAQGLKRHALVGPTLGTGGKIVTLTALLVPADPDVFR